MRKLIIIILLTTIGNGLVSGMQEPIKEASPANLPIAKVGIKKGYKKLSSKPIRAVLSSYKGKAAPVAKSGGNIEQIVREAARKYGLDEDHFVSIARCESTFQSSIVNNNYTAPDGSNPTGVFQFIRTTYISYASLAGFPPKDDRLNAYNNINVAAWAFKNGHAAAWECR